jgi:chaperonin GroES
MKTPLGNRVVIELIQEEKKSASGIILDAVKDKHVKAKVLSISPDITFNFLKEELEVLEMANKHYPEQYDALKAEYEGRRPLIAGDTVLIQAGAGITTEEYGTIVPYEQIIMLVN